MKILVVDDDPNIQQLVGIHLSREGYRVLCAEHAEHALQLLEDEDVDLAIVDVMMPGMNGYELTSILTNDLRIPVILLTAKGQLSDKERGFDAGSDDYVVKPFEPKELLFRVAVVLRRIERMAEAIVQVGNVRIDRRNYEIAIQSETLLFPMKEFELLSLLAGRVNKAVTRSELIEHVWGDDLADHELTLNTHMNRLRDRLKKYGASVEIRTIRGVGYRLEG